MAEKEERIYIDVENDKLDRLKHLSMTRQEAIECMARASHKYELTYSPVPMPTWCELNDDVKNDYRKKAKAELNALLEGKSL